MRFREVELGVFYPSSESLRVALGDAEVAMVRERAQHVPRGRARICAHRSPDDPLHEMLIALLAGGYVRPHRHRGRGESFHVVEGEATLVVFDEQGRATSRVELGLGPGKTRLHRMNAPEFHTVIVSRGCFVVHEVTLGPFRPGSTEVAPWAPAEDDVDAIAAFMESLRAMLHEGIE